MNAFSLASSIRYIDDVKLKTFSPNPDLINNYEAGLALNSLKISKEITPELYESLKITCENIYLDIRKVSAYVTSSPEIQAGCLSFSKDKCIITVTSAVINLLNSNEINFILGHELGHFLFSHNIEERNKAESQEGYIKKRAQEISVDRIGLMACKDINIATRAMIKSLSGLDEKYINFNMKGFLSQLELDVAKKEESGQFSSHPSFILRVKALFRFSLSEEFRNHKFNESGSNLSEIDKMIQKDLNQYIDRDLRKDIEHSRKMLRFWSYALAYIKDGSFSKNNQTILAEKFDNEFKNKLINMITDMSKNEAIRTVQDKLIESIYNFRKIAPNAAKKELNILLMKIEKETNKKDFFKDILRKF